MGLVKRKGAAVGVGEAHPASIPVISIFSRHRARKIEVVEGLQLNQDGCGDGLFRTNVPETETGSDVLRQRPTCRGGQAAVVDESNSAG